MTVTLHSISEIVGRFFENDLDRVSRSILRHDFNSIAKILVSRNVNLNAVSDIIGDVPLKSAVDDENPYIIKLLIEEGGADPDFAAPDRLSPRKYAEITNRSIALEAMSSSSLKHNL